ncbi:MAG: thioredoxin [Elusimicrobia bacterium]|nr:thioredoxin [Elusimicrobiota bacterium]
MASREEAGLSASSREKLKNIDKEVNLDVFVTSELPQSSQPSVIACKIAVEIKNNIKVRIIDVSQAVKLVQDSGISSVPAVIVNRDKDSLLEGFLSEDKIVNLVVKYGSSKADEILAKEIEEEKKRQRLVDNPDYPVVLTDENFDKAVEKYPFLVVDCWAEWCGPCQMIHPVIESLAKKKKGEIVFGKLNVDENRQISGKFGIMSIPTMLVFKNGKNIDRIVGAMPEQMLEEKLNRYK